MRIKYNIFCNPMTDPMGVVDTVTIEICGDPNSREHRDAAISASGRNPSDVWIGGVDSVYEARFVGYDGPTVEVPFVAMEAMALLMNGDLSVTNWATLRTVLLASGCIEERTHHFQAVCPE